VNKINDVTFQLKLSDPMKIHLTFHASLLEPYHAFTILGKVFKLFSPIEINGEQKYEGKKKLLKNIT
jgi:hypothetical protein